MDTEMPPDTFDSAPTHARRGILWLVMAHVVVGFVGALLVKSAGSDFGWAIGACVASWFGQASLLGIWLGLGKRPHITRVMSVALGVIILYLSMGLASGDWSGEIVIVLGVSIAFVSTPLLLARCFRIAIQVDSSPTTLASRLRFSIRHLLILTLVVACAITLGRIVLQDNPQRQFMLGLMTYGTIFQMMGVVPVWLILATKQPVLHGLGLVTISACAGYTLGWMVDLPIRVQTMVILAAGTSVVVISLLVVRLCGYRLVRLPKKTPRRSRPTEFSIPHLNDEESQSNPLSP